MCSLNWAMKNNNIIYCSLLIQFIGFVYGAIKYLATSNKIRYRYSKTVHHPFSISVILIFFFIIFLFHFFLVVRSFALHTKYIQIHYADQIHDDFSFLDARNSNIFILERLRLKRTFFSFHRSLLTVSVDIRRAFGLYTCVDEICNNNSESKGKFIHFAILLSFSRLWSSWFVRFAICIQTHRTQFH